MGEGEREKEIQREKKCCDTRDGRGPITGEEMITGGEKEERKMSRKRRRWRRRRRGEEEEQKKKRTIRKRRRTKRRRSETRFSCFSLTASKPHQAKLNKHTRTFAPCDSGLFSSRGVAASCR